MNVPAELIIVLYAQPYSLLKNALDAMLTSVSHATSTASALSAIGITFKKIVHF